ncbi:MAG: diguanylate cyclase [Planctomycetota bacterium]|jgi:two-component system chemotaxis response regulator CheY|nr:diguanylate cyclase [Planctomycetota bacterium]
MKILIVDDEIVPRRVLEKQLSNWGHEVLMAKDGAEALQLFHDHQVKMVITDWMMPGLNGPQLCAEIRKAEAESDNPAFVILLTSKNSSEDLAHGLDLGANDFITKPFKKLELQARLRNGVRILQLQAELLRKKEEAVHLARTDTLTQLMNRRAMLDVMRLDEDRMRRERRPLGMVMIDIDKFKNINDTYGHTIGDLVLQETAKCFAQTIRGGDYLGRWGGEEFLIALPGADIIQCAEVAERCRTRIAALRFPLEDGSVLSVTASFGTASAEGADRVGLLELVNQADKALYWAKDSGRNRVKIYVASADTENTRHG